MLELFFFSLECQPYCGFGWFWS